MRLPRERFNGIERLAADDIADITEHIVTRPRPRSDQRDSGPAYRPRTRN
jgi:hypothetical protein